MARRKSLNDIRNQATRLMNENTTRGGFKATGRDNQSIAQAAARTRIARGISKFTKTPNAKKSIGGLTAG